MAELGVEAVGKRRPKDLKKPAIWRLGDDLGSRFHLGPLDLDTFSVVRTSSTASLGGNRSRHEKTSDITSEKIPEKVVATPVNKGPFQLTWLNFWILTHFVVGIGDFLFGIAVLLGWLNLETPLRFLGGFILVLGGCFFLGMSVRLFQRRRSGLTLSYIYLVFLALASLGNIAVAFEEEPTVIGVLVGLVAAIASIGICWL